MTQLMKTEPNRIYFLDNPYPNGHKVSEFIWSGRVDEDETIWFDFHLETDNYYSEDENNDEPEEEESNWKSKIVWGNYNSCKISSICWGEENKGIKISDNSEKLNFNNCINKELMIDILPLDEYYDYEDLAFNIYLLGHDSCANHKIIFKENENNYDIEWTGKIALSYSGDDEFNYDFKANINNVKFDGFYFPTSWSLEKAKEVFHKNFEDFENYEFVDIDPEIEIREYKLVRREK